MDGREHAAVYEDAVLRLQKHIKRNDDGTLMLIVERVRDLAEAYPTAYNDLVRSLEMTNRKIRDGELDPSQISIQPI